MIDIWPWRRKSVETASTPHELESMLRSAIAQASNGMQVTPANALKVPEVLACINVLAQGFAMLPLSVNQKTDSGRSKIKNHPIYKVMSQKPNHFQSPFEFKRTMMFNAAWRGNAYAYISRFRGNPIELLPLEPGTTKCELLSDWTLKYTVTPDLTKPNITQTYDQSQILHLRGHINYRGWISEDPIEYLRNTIATMMAIDLFSGKYYRGGSKANGAFVLPDKGTLDDAAFERLKSSLNEAANGDEAPLFEQGLTWLKMDYSARESLLAEMQSSQINKLCRGWRIQPHMIQQLDNATYTNIEHQSREHVDYTLMPWIILWEQAILGQMMDPMNDAIYPKISAQALLRGDNKTRSEVYRQAVGGPYMVPNEARELEDMDSVEGGDELLRPVNMQDADASPTTED